MISTGAASNKITSPQWMKGLSNKITEEECDILLLWAYCHSLGRRTICPTRTNITVLDLIGTWPPPRGHSGSRKRALKMPALNPSGPCLASRLQWRENDICRRKRKKFLCDLPNGPPGPPDPMEGPRHPSPTLCLATPPRTWSTITMMPMRDLRRPKRAMDGRRQATAKSPSSVTLKWTVGENRWVQCRTPDSFKEPLQNQRFGNPPSKRQRGKYLRSFFWKDFFFPLL